MYIASWEDPVDTIFKEMHLTPNSVNIHSRWLKLAPGLRIGGYVERSQISSQIINPSINEDSDSPLSSTIEEGEKSIDIVRELLTGAPVSAIDAAIEQTSIFVLRPKYSHTMNQFIFFCDDELKSSGTSLCIVPASSEVAEASVPVMTINGSDYSRTILFPSILKTVYNYCIVEYELESCLPTGFKWTLKGIKKCNL